ncbi:DUF4142 domain-containing protein [Prosthecobacter dejongeii]|uniref:Putative membrane protein n=1 Tax=Prosthecobacter dejongeii TaxID=48465 RepID=A0A7W7YIL8_9BACT|nr:DUF4142 domain-containing protein [Prosthecobacter dejongeii]MBB5036824.1 putative membrane protein [Prosthecobacter dejongeii]
MKTSFLTAAFAGLAMLATSVSAADSKSSLTPADEKFVKAASQHGMGEVQIAALGVKKGAREDVKALAEKMVLAHTTMNTELTALAKAKGVELSTVTDPADTEILKELENTNTGEAFDKAFLNRLEADHKEAIDLFTEASEDSKDAEVKTWAGKALPDLRNHLDAVQTAIKK